MNIPQNLKVGGKVYTVEQTDRLVIGDQFMGETIYKDLMIRIRPGDAPAVKEVTFLHEMLHTVYNHLGYVDHDEKKIDELANALHMIIIDNPSIFEVEKKTE